ncbi:MULTISPECIES: hypothetical protein [Bacillus cereus group]|uniref:Uncharacterized protein n=1 Tax=Bacillus thuringiensis TaxID=1428 RepID=A0AB36V803_BACTU|nr:MULTISPECIES: hypothetical protein [Bacillus cereus group]EJV74528.1 hypothetical protein IGE_05648 [Bacillus cereus HuB1-1]MED3621020.1 hypothetical protein [Bacillus thuringiensis]PGZ02215.1 hypothetical protein COE48_18155 [Bacillus thuringiensis]
MIVGIEFQGEYYHCQNCNTFHSRNELKELREQKGYPDGRWNCLVCKNAFQIYTQENGHSRYSIVERTLVKDLAIGDEVVFATAGKNIYELKKKYKRGKGKVSLSFLEYGSTTEDEDDWVNRYVGQWHGDTSQLK